MSENVFRTFSLRDRVEVYEITGNSVYRAIVRKQNPVDDCCLMIGCYCPFLIGSCLFVGA